MSTIWERLHDALDGLGLPMAQDFYPGTGSQLPDAYLIYLLISSNPAQHFDNTEESRQYHIQITYYDRDGLAGMPEIAGAMVAADFTRGPTRELPYSQETRHFGLALEFWYCE